MKLFEIRRLQNFTD